MATLTLKLDDNTALWLRREAKRLGRPASALVRDAIVRLRDRQGDASVLSLVEDTLGAVASSVQDLASNEAHLAGFGRKPMKRRTKDPRKVGR